MAFKLHKDQQRIVNSLMNNLDKNNLVVSPCGSGKTVIIGRIVKNLLDRDKKVIVIVPSTEVKQQMYKTLAEFGAHTDIETSIKFNNLGNSLDSMDYIIIDEAHHSEATNYKELFSRFPRAKRIGFTATPTRLDKKELSNSFNNLIEGLTVRELINENRLSTFKYYAPNLHNTIPSIEDFNNENNYYLYNLKKPSHSNTQYRGRMFGDVIKTYLSLANGKQTILFAKSIDDSKDFAYNFCLNGIPAAHVDGTTYKEERDRIIRDFRKGRIKILCNCDLISEGFDMNDCEAVILARRTESLTLYLQQAFRALRYKPGKEAIILDHANNVEFHNSVDMDRYWSLNYSGNDEEVDESPAARKRRRTNYEIERRPLRYIFDNSIELEQMDEISGSEFDNELNKALEMRGLDSFKELVRIQTKYNIVPKDGQSWSYTMAKHYNKIDV